jgi:hypothetical protein
MLDEVDVPKTKPHPPPGAGFRQAAQQQHLQSKSSSSRILQSKSVAAGAEPTTVMDICAGYLRTACAAALAVWRLLRFERTSSHASSTLSMQVARSAMLREPARRVPRSAGGCSYAGSTWINQEHPMAGSCGLPSR